MRTRTAVLAAALLSGTAPALGTDESALLRFAASDRVSPSAAKQLRNAEAFRDVLRKLPAARRPRRILYLASGSHIAPLAACELLPRRSPCALTFTEVDPGVRRPLQAVLAELQAAGLVRRLAFRENRAGGRWAFTLSGRPVTLSLRIVERDARATSPVHAEVLGGHDLTISHDWSGDPLANLRLILDYLRAVRSRGPAPPPPLLLEDLERHPYPIDLSFFGPLARTSLAYGHRASRDGSVGHDGDELGPPLFGGAALLGFGDPWWRRVDDGDLAGFFDFLLLGEFDAERRNVLTRGGTAVVAPALLDWWTAFGRRTVESRDLFRHPEVRREMLSAAVRVTPLLDPVARRRLACRLVLYRTLAALKVLGYDTTLLTAPDGGFDERVLSPEMERAHAEARERTALQREEAEVEKGSLRGVATLLDTPEARAIVALCPLESTSPVTETGLALLYRSARRHAWQDAAP